MLRGLNSSETSFKTAFVLKIIRESFQENILLILIPQLLAFWHVWFWYLKRVTDISDEPWGLLALITVLFLLFFDKPVKHDESVMLVKCKDSGRLITLRRLPEKIKDKLVNIAEKKSANLFIPAFLILFYCSTNRFLPDIFQAAIAFVSLSYSIGIYKLKKPFNLSVTALFLLSLPLIPSLQFYLGYPVRIFTSAITIQMLKLNGLFVLQEGTCLKWGTQTICIDVPCSGVKMLWTGLYLCFTIALLYKLTFKQTILTFIFSFITIITGNIIRATALFYTEAKILPLPDFTHEGIGLIMFLFMAISIGMFSQYIKREKYA